MDILRRAATLKATLKSTRAFDRVRQHIQAELRLVDGLTKVESTTDPEPRRDHLRLVG